MLFKTDEERDSTELGGKRGGYGYTTRVPLKDLAPGHYVLKVEARSRLGDTPPVAREVQFTVEPARRRRRDDRAGLALASLLAQSLPSGWRRRHAGADRGRSTRAIRATSTTRRQVLVRTDGRVDDAVAAARARPAAAGGRLRAARWWSACSWAAGRPPASASRSSARRGDSGALVVRVPRDARRRADAITAQVLTSPYHLVAIPKRDGDGRQVREGRQAAEACLERLPSHFVRLLSSDVFAAAASPPASLSPAAVELRHARAA